MSFFTKALKGSVAKTERITLNSIKEQALKGLQAKLDKDPISALCEIESIQQKLKTERAKAHIEANRQKREAGELVKVGSMSFTINGKEKVVPIEERKNSDGSITQWAITRDGLFPKRLSTLEKQNAYYGTEAKIEWNSEVSQ